MPHYRRGCEWTGFCDTDGTRRDSALEQRVPTSCRAATESKNRLTRNNKLPLPCFRFCKLMSVHLLQELPAVCYVVTAQVAQACIPVQCYKGHALQSVNVRAMRVGCPSLHQKMRQPMSCRSFIHLHVLIVAMHRRTGKDAVIGSRLLVPVLHSWGIPRLIFLPAHTVPELFGTRIGDLKHAYLGRHILETSSNMCHMHSCRDLPL